MKTFAKDFYKSVAWKSARKYFADSKHNLCEECLKKGIYKKGEIVHHKIFITPENIGDTNVTLNFNNLELLCRDCHALRHKKEKNRRFTVNADGSVNIRSPRE